jgi:hypothetical protein
MLCSTETTLCFWKTYRLYVQGRSLYRLILLVSSLDYLGALNFWGTYQFFLRAEELAACFCWLLAWVTLWPWRWRWYVSLKHWALPELHGITILKTTLFIISTIWMFFQTVRLPPNYMALQPRRPCSSQAPPREHQIQQKHLCSCSIYNENPYYVRFEVFRIIAIKITVFWEETPFSLDDGSTFLQNGGIYLANYKMSHPKMQPQMWPNGSFYKFNIYVYI